MKRIVKMLVPAKLKNLLLGKSEEKEGIKNTFTEIYKNNYWNSTESVSGTGSDLSQTITLISELNELIKKLNIKSILDIPCGDFNWMQKVDLAGINYTGADIVSEIIEENKIKFKNFENLQFKVMDLTSDSLPKVDLIFCRDCLVHLSYPEIFKALANIKASGSQYLLTTSFTNRFENQDIVTGYWRPLNLQIQPFTLTEPILAINENCTENEGIYNDKSMCLWKISELNTSL